MKYKNYVLRASALILTVALTGTVHAAGYQLNEYSTTGMGRSFAGAGVVADDFSAIGYNPAGMSLNKTNGVQMTTSVVSLYSRFKGDNGFGQSGRGQTRITRVLPAGFAQYKLNDKLTAGLGVYTPFGLATDYDNGWFGEMHGGLSEVTVLNVSPALSYQLTDKVSLGASANLQRAEARLTSINPLNGSNVDLRGNDWAAGYSVGMTYKPVENVRFGVSYRSKVSHALKGKLNRVIDIGAKIETPETVWVSGSWDVNDKWTLSGSFRWTRWERFDMLDITSTANGAVLSSTAEKWRNTRFYTLGADYKYNNNWTFRFGGAYDTTVISNPSHRTPRIPDGRRFWTSLGLSYNYKNMQFDFGYAHIFVHGGRAHGTVTGYPNPNIKYSSDANMVSFGAQYKF